MIYRLGDRLVVDGIQCEIGFINAGKAWVFPVTELMLRDGHSLVPWASMKVIDLESEVPYVSQPTTCGAV